MIHTFAVSFSDDDNSTPVIYTSTASGDGQTNVDVFVASGASNHDIVAVIDISEVKSLLINSDITAGITFKSGANTVQSMTLSGNKPLLWQEGFPNTCPITGDFTKIVVTSATADLNVKGFFLNNV